MEIIEIKSQHSLVTSITENRPEGPHSYIVNCRQYVSAFQSWQRTAQAQPHAFGVMTLDFVRIWITETEGKQIAAAIQSASSPVAVA